MSLLKKSSFFVTPLFLLGFVFFITQCAKEEVFPELGDNIASPIDVVASPDKNYFYVLNADMSRIYNKGSILVLDVAGKKVAAIETPRSGRSLTVAGSKLFVAFDTTEAEGGSKAQVQIYDLSDEALPKLDQSFEMDCTPLNVAARAGYNYFASTCQTGDLWVGDLAKKTFKRVRQYKSRRRAMYIDKSRNLLFAFVTNLGEIKLNDKYLTDEASWDVNFTRTEGADEIPDDYDSDRFKRRGSQSGSLRSRIKLVVYDIEKAASEGFPFYSEVDGDEEIEAELRWLYFDADPETEAAKNTKTKSYRTNFWDAKPASEDGSFYISHRGLGTADKSPESNEVLKMSIIADPKTNFKFSEFMKVERVYTAGSVAEQAKHPAYTSGFDVTTYNSKEVLLVNNFRDLSYFRTHGGGLFEIFAKNLEDDNWSTRLDSTSSSDAFYQIAGGKGGVAATCSFYSNSVILLEVKPDTDIRIIKRI